MTFRRLLRSFLLALAAGLFPLLMLWKNNLGQTPPSGVVPSLVYTILFIILVFAGWFLLVRSPEKAALLSCVTSIFVFSFGHLFNFIGGVVVLGISIGFVKLFLALFLLYVAACLAIIKIKRLPDPRLLVYPAGLLVVFNTASILSFSVQDGSLRAPPPAAEALAQPGGQDLPDIYYIVLDMYARNDILRDVLGYDNSAFTQALRARGFYLPECAYSNYDGTRSAMTSILNYDSLMNMGAVKVDEAETIDLIHNNRASQVFRSYGYQFVSGRGYASFNDIETSDIYLNYAIDQGIEDDLAEQRFTSLYLNTTVFRLLSELYKQNPMRFSQLPAWLAIDRASDPSLAEANFWYLQNNYMFDALEEFPEKPGSFFVYAHINGPHSPYVYRQDGSFRYPLDDQPEEVLVADMITYINKRVLEVVDVLQEKSDPAPIIIIQGDHGLHTLTTGLDKHKILNAYFLPGELLTPPYDTITPVNNFPLILRNYFDPSIELQPDTLWVHFINEIEPVPADCSLTP